MNEARSLSIEEKYKTFDNLLDLLSDARRRGHLQRYLVARKGLSAGLRLSTSGSIIPSRLLTSTHQWRLTSARYEYTSHRTASACSSASTWQPRSLASSRITAEKSQTSDSIGHASPDQTDLRRMQHARAPSIKIRHVLELSSLGFRLDLESALLQALWAAPSAKDHASVSCSQTAARMKRRSPSQRCAISWKHARLRNGRSCWICGSDRQVAGMRSFGQSCRQSRTRQKLWE